MIKDWVTRFDDPEEEMVKQSRAMLVWVAAGVRAFFIVYGEWQDRQMEVAYTDVDYKVYSDASALMAKGRSPFERDTYRYSPLLALLLLPNALLHPSWGKILFSLADLMVGDIIYKILRYRGVPDSSCVKCMALWLFNPFTFTIATRGSCESIPCCMILWVLFCLLTGRVIEAAIYYGLVVHLRIYPIIYVFAILIVLDGGHTKTTKKSEGFVDFDHNTDRKSVDGGFMLFALLRKLINRDRVVFGLVSGGLFFALTGISYIFYGDKFLFEALLYHLTRTDHRHNFSIYFYHIYLHHGSDFTTVERLVSFVPQFVVQAFLTTYFAQDLPFCFFVQTVAFVAFNKVITAQYFVWFFCLLPLILPWTNLRLRWKGGLSIALWTCSQLHWLAWAYELEFQGRNVFLQLWSASLLFFLVNILVLSTLINNHSFPASLMPNDNKKD